MKSRVSGTGAPTTGEKKGHVLPPSDATHPRDRWESLFVYSFICKFTKLRGKTEGFNNAMDFEEAILATGPHPILVAILAKFILNLKPNTRNTSADQISSTLAGVLNEYFKTGERTVFWDNHLNTNVDPFVHIDEGFFAAPWDLKLKILRTLVELQLCHSATIKSTIDAAWGIIHNKQKRKDVMEPGQPDSNDPFSMESLAFTPLGQDFNRRRYWVVDDSPRVYLSTNPWKVSSTFHAVASTRDEYAALTERLKTDAPPPGKGGKRMRLEAAHANLIEALEGRLEMIDKEIARIERTKKKAQQKAILQAQAELRSTRTRRQIKRPDYVYNDAIESDDDPDDSFVPGKDEPHEDDEDFGSDSPSSSRHVPSNGRRRSARTAAAAAANGKHLDTEWKGERRSRRLGAGLQLDEPPRKRARTTDTASSDGVDVESVPDSATTSTTDPIKAKGAAAIKDGEKVVEQVAGKKKSKFWYYAVESIGSIGGTPERATDVDTVNVEANTASREADKGEAIRMDTVEEVMVL